MTKKNSTKQFTGVFPVSDDIFEAQNKRAAEELAKKKSTAPKKKVAVKK